MKDKLNFLDKEKKKLLNRPQFSPKTGLLEDAVPALTDYQIQCAIRDVNPDTLAAALAGAGGRVILRFLDNLADRGQAMMLDDIEFFKKSPVEEIIKAQENVLAKLVDT